jgi:chromosome segregation ATPase
MDEKSVKGLREWGEVREAVAYLVDKARDAESNVMDARATLDDLRDSVSDRISEAERDLESAEGDLSILRDEAEGIVESMREMDIASIRAEVDALREVITAATEALSRLVVALAAY